MDAKAFHARLDEYYAAGDIPGAYDYLCREKAAAAGREPVITNLKNIAKVCN